MNKDELKDRRRALCVADAMKHYSQDIGVSVRHGSAVVPIDFGLVWAGGDLRPGQQRMRGILTDLYRDVSEAIDRAQAAMEAVALESWE